MERKASGALIWLSISMTTAVLIVSFILLGIYGTVEVIKPSSYGLSPSIEKVTNWPLIIGLVFGGLYSFLFTGIAIQMNHTHDRIADIHNKLKADQPD